MSAMKGNVLRVVRDPTKMPSDVEVRAARRACGADDLMRVIIRLRKVRATFQLRRRRHLPSLRFLTREALKHDRKGTHTRVAIGPTYAERNNDT